MATGLQAATTPHSESSKDGASAPCLNWLFLWCVAGCFSGAWYVVHGHDVVLGLGCVACDVSCGASCGPSCPTRAHLHTVYLLQLLPVIAKGGCSSTIPPLLLRKWAISFSLAPPTLCATCAWSLERPAGKEKCRANPGAEIGAKKAECTCVPPPWIPPPLPSLSF